MSDRRILGHRVRWWRACLASLIVGTAAVSMHSRVWASFSSASSTEGNRFASGTVLIGDNDLEAAMFTLAAMKPADAAVSKCITVTYSGSLPANVRLYGTTTGTGLDEFVKLTVTRGTFTPTNPGFSGCGNFDSDDTDYIGAGAGIVFKSDLRAWPDTYAAGLADPPTGTAESWTTGEVHAYQFTVTLKSDIATASLSATQSFTWEARNT